MQLIQLLLLTVLAVLSSQKYCCALNVYSICEDDENCCKADKKKKYCDCTDESFGRCYACGCVSQTYDQIIE